MLTIPLIIYFSKSKRRVLRKVERVQIDVDIPHIFLDRDLVLQSIQNINISQNVSIAQ